MTRTEMCYDGALVMPSNYAVMNEEEMTYLEGGAWSANTLKNNLMALTKYGRAFSQAGFSIALVKACALYSYAMACTMFGGKVVSIALMIGGVAMGIIAGLAAAAAINYLGRNRVWY